MSSQKLNIVYCLDKAYLIPFCCSLSSYLDHNLTLTNNIYLIHDLGVEEDWRLAQIKSFIDEKYNRQITSILIDSDRFRSLRNDLHISPATYYRFEIHERLKNEDWVLSIDCDTIVTGSMDALLEYRYPTYYAAAVEHGFGHVPKRIVEFNPDKTSYFNAGVLLLNAKKLRDDFSSKDFIDFGETNRAKLPLWDQDVLNIYFGNNWNELPLKYNDFTGQKRKELPKVIHFTGNRKPWNYFCDHPYRDLYWCQIKNTPFYIKSLASKNVIGKFINTLLKIRLKFP